MMMKGTGNLGNQVDCERELIARAHAEKAGKKASWGNPSGHAGMWGSKEALDQFGWREAHVVDCRPPAVKVRGQSSFRGLLVACRIR